MITDFALRIKGGAIAPPLYERLHSYEHATLCVHTRVAKCASSFNPGFNKSSSQTPFFQSQMLEFHRNCIELFIKSIALFRKSVNEASCFEFNRRAPIPERH